MTQVSAMGREQAEALAIAALGFLAQDREALGAFLDAAGAGPGDLRDRAREPDFLGFVLDFLLQDEPLLIAFCDAERRDYDAPMRARAALPGGDLPHWT
ncbi:MAG: DUF3572 domain-containing protein [Pseudomonadota bacterium]